MNWERRWSTGTATWDHGEPSPPLAAYLQNHAMEGSVIVPGCGSGHDARLLAVHGLSVLAVDISATAIETARRYPAAGELKFLEADWLRLPVGLGGQFDWVVEHTCFCALDPSRRADYVDAVDFALRRGGRLLAVFYLDPAAPEGPPFGVAPGELTELFNRFQLIARWRPTEGFESRLGREEMRLYKKA